MENLDKMMLKPRDGVQNLEEILKY